MPGNRLNCLQTLLKITCDQFVLIIHLGKNREVQHQLWEKHVNQEEGEPLEGVGGSWSVCCWRSSRMGQACICEKWPWQGGSFCGQRKSRLDFLRPLPALRSASCSDMDLHPLLSPLSCVSPTVWPQPRLTRPFAGMCLPPSSKSLKYTLNFLPLLFLLSLSPSPFSPSFPLHFPSSRLLWTSILSHGLTGSLAPLCRQISHGNAMSPFMVKLTPKRWMRNLHSQVSASLLQTVCLFTPALVTFG